MLGVPPRMADLVQRYPKPQRNVIPSQPYMLPASQHHLKIMLEVSQSHYIITQIRLVVPESGIPARNDALVPFVYWWIDLWMVWRLCGARLLLIKDPYTIGLVVIDTLTDLFR